MPMEVIPDGATTYCWASSASSTDAQIDASDLGSLGRGNGGGLCPLTFSMQMARTFVASDKPTITWALLQTDGTTFLNANVTQNVTTSQLFYCRATDATCLPFQNAKPLSTPVLPPSQQYKTMFLSSPVSLPPDAGDYIFFVMATLPANQTHRIDAALFTKVTIQAAMPTSPPSSNHTGLYIGVGVGAFVVIVAIVIWCCLTQRRVRRLERELHRATFVSMQAQQRVMSLSIPKPDYDQQDIQAGPFPLSRPTPSYSNTSHNYSTSAQVDQILRGSRNFFPNQHNAHYSVPPRSPSNASTDYSTHPQVHASNIRTSFPSDHVYVLRSSEHWSAFSRGSSYHS
ncbi:hypothetical protein LEN26_006040 [Aphanomyces euteiches]|nr:hypothetical protein AeMF1_011902 [Aphanomyces euteiches]KAH9136685.1 hypothetical protein LEN26_006040 [Aphanomyces euteiches]KAH9193730.1 hypothetical protein AeNC1_004285 [Aphanomyces euteiches]